MRPHKADPSMAMMCQHLESNFVMKIESFLPKMVLAGCSFLKFSVHEALKIYAQLKMTQIHFILVTEFQQLRFYE
jgi:hypothetical protein